MKLNTPIPPMWHKDHPQLVRHLFDWQFSRALAVANETSAPVHDFHQDVIETLARMFGDCGWFDGDMAVLVRFAVTELIGREEPRD